MSERAFKSPSHQQRTSQACQVAASIVEIAKHFMRSAKRAENGSLDAPLCIRSFRKWQHADIFAQCQKDALVTLQIFLK